MESPRHFPNISPDSWHSLDVDTSEVTSSLRDTVAAVAGPDSGFGRDAARPRGVVVVQDASVLRHGDAEAHTEAASVHQRLPIHASGPIRVSSAGASQAVPSDQGSNDSNAAASIGLTALPVSAIPGGGGGDASNAITDSVASTTTESNIRSVDPSVNRDVSALSSTAKSRELDLPSWTPLQINADESEDEDDEDVRPQEHDHELPTHPSPEIGLISTTTTPSPLQKSSKPSSVRSTKSVGDLENTVLSVTPARPSEDIVPESPASSSPKAVPQSHDVIDLISPPETPKRAPRTSKALTSSAASASTSTRQQTLPIPETPQASVPPQTTKPLSLSSKPRSTTRSFLEGVVIASKPESEKSLYRRLSGNEVGLAGHAGKEGNGTKDSNSTHEVVNALQHVFSANQATSLSQENGPTNAKRSRQSDSIAAVLQRAFLKNNDVRMNEALEAKGREVTRGRPYGPKKAASGSGRSSGMAALAMEAPKAPISADTSKPFQRPRRGLPVTTYNYSTVRAPYSFGAPKDIQYNAASNMIDELLGTKESIIDWDEWIEEDGHVCRVENRMGKDGGGQIGTDMAVDTNKEGGGYLGNEETEMNRVDGDGRVKEEIISGNEENIKTEETTEENGERRRVERLERETMANVRFVLRGTTAQLQTKQPSAVFVPYGKDRGSQGSGVEGKRPWGPGLEGLMCEYKSRVEMFRERLEARFGAGNIGRGAGGRPKRLRYQQEVMYEEEANREEVEEVGSARSGDDVAGIEGVEGEDGDEEVNGDDEEEVNGDVKVDNIVLGKREREVIDVDEVMEEEPRETKKTRREGPGEWAGVIQRLVKGKTRIDEEGLGVVSEVMGEIEGKGEMTEELAEAVGHLSRLGDIPFGDTHRLRRRAAAAVGVTIE